MRHAPGMVLGLLVGLVSCSFSPPEGETSEGMEQGTTDGTTGGSSTTTTAPVTTGPDPCMNITCSGHGTCVFGPSGLACECDPGYVAEGFSCLPDGPSTSTTTTTSTSTSTMGASDSDPTTGDTTGSTGMETVDPTSSSTGVDETGDLPNGEPCDDPGQCAGGFCWADFNNMNFPPETCHDVCIEPGDADAWCYDENDCCEGFCAPNGYCMQG